MSDAYDDAIDLAILPGTIGISESGQAHIKINKCIADKDEATFLSAEKDGKN